MQHHAYYIEDSVSRFEEYRDLLKPFWARAYERFWIDEARELIALSSLKNFNNPVYFLAISAATSEAQQALLKLLEEPQQGTMFVFLVPHGILIPTVKSRMLPYPEKLDAESASSAKKFLSMSGKERSDFVAKLLKDDPPRLGEAGEGTKDRVRDFLNGLELELSKKIADPKARLALADVAMARDYLGDRSPSLKMLLEHLAIALP